MPGVHQAVLSLHSSDGQGRENTTIGLWVVIRAERIHSPVMVTGKTDSNWGNWFNLLPVKSE